MILMVSIPSITCLPATVYAPQASWDRMKAGQPLPAPPPRTISWPRMQPRAGPPPPGPGPGPASGAVHQVPFP